MDKLSNYIRDQITLIFLFSKKYSLNYLSVVFLVCKVQIFWEGHTNLKQSSTFLKLLICVKEKWKIVSKFLWPFSECKNFMSLLMCSYKTYLLMLIFIFRSFDKKDRFFVLDHFYKGAFTYDVRCFWVIFDLPTLIRYRQMWLDLPTYPKIWRQI